VKPLAPASIQRRKRSLKKIDPQLTATHQWHDLKFCYSMNDWPTTKGATYAEVDKWCLSRCAVNLKKALEVRNWLDDWVEREMPYGTKFVSHGDLFATLGTRLFKV
jgi:hypothetical protein